MPYMILRKILLVVVQISTIGWNLPVLDVVAPLVGALVRIDDC